MDISRRMLVTATGAAVVAPQLAQAAAPLLPAKSEFAPMSVTYMDSGSVHPLSLGAKAAVEEYLLSKTMGGQPPGYNSGAKERQAQENVAKLIGCAPDELTFIQSTTMGENLAIRALNIPETGGRIVTDALHFFGSFYTYGELGKAGMDVVTLPMTKDGRIDYKAMEAAVNKDTKLVAVSLVSTTNGYQHDLKRVCDIAHAHGAYVYADIIHGVGSIPVDLHASGVDFAAFSSYKWLMGDFGLGFLYVRKGLEDKLRRPWWGYHQVSKMTTHVFPHDTAGDTVADYETPANAEGMFSMGTTSRSVAVQLAYSTDWLLKTGVENIQAWRQPMADAIQKTLRKRGYEPLTPLDSKTPLVAFALKDARTKLAEPLKAANVRITIAQNRFRVSLAVFNDMNDVDKLLEALPKRPG